MITPDLLSEIGALVQTLLQDEPDYFLVSLRIKPIHNIKVYLDGDAGLSIEKCIFFNRKLYKMIEESQFFPEGDFSLEVSSPGVDEPLGSHRRYAKNVGRLIEIVFKDDTKKMGKLLQVADADLIIEVTSGKGKKAVTEQMLVPFDNIKTTTVQIQF